jgi:hypothetical protein
VGSDGSGGKKEGMETSIVSNNISGGGDTTGGFILSFDNLFKKTGGFEGIDGNII